MATSEIFGKCMLVQLRCGVEQRFICPAVVVKQSSNLGFVHVFKRSNALQLSRQDPQGATAQGADMMTQVFVGST